MSYVQKMFWVRKVSLIYHKNQNVLINAQIPEVVISHIGRINA